MAFRAKNPVLGECANCAGVAQRMYDGGGRALLCSARCRAEWYKRYECETTWLLMELVRQLWNGRTEIAFHPAPFPADKKVYRNAQVKAGEWVRSLSAEAAL